jgi:DNA-binding PadR family transcriptional regulator
VLAHPYSSRPLRFIYELTDSGRELADALRLLAEWGARRSGHSEPLRHEACGTALEVRWYCPTCECAVEEGEATDVDYV